MYDHSIVQVFDHPTTFMSRGNHQKTLDRPIWDLTLSKFESNHGTGVAGWTVSRSTPRITRVESMCDHGLFLRLGRLLWLR